MIHHLRQRALCAAVPSSAQVHADIGEHHGPAQAHAQDLADQLGGAASGDGPVADPAADRGVVIQQAQAVPVAEPVDAPRQAAVRHARLVDDGIEQDVLLSHRGSSPPLNIAV
jgi:hypothetical protein